MRSLVLRGFCVATLLLSSCTGPGAGSVQRPGAAPLDPVTGGALLQVAAEADEIAAAAQRHEALLAALGGAKQLDPVHNHTLRSLRVFSDLAAVVHRPQLPWQVHLIARPELRAFTPGAGYVYLYDGVFGADALVSEGDDDELAALLAHLMAHTALLHTSLEPNWQRDSELGRRDPFHGASFTAEQEEEADRLSTLYMALTGYNPRAAWRVWGRAARGFGSRDLPEFLTHHPLSLARADRVAAAASEVQRYYSAGELYPEWERVRAQSPLFPQAIATAAARAPATAPASAPAAASTPAQPALASSAAAARPSAVNPPPPSAAKPAPPNAAKPAARPPVAPAQPAPATSRPSSAPTAAVPSVPPVSAAPAARAPLTPPIPADSSAAADRGTSAAPAPSARPLPTPAPVPTTARSTPPVTRPTPAPQPSAAPPQHGPVPAAPAEPQAEPRRTAQTELPPVQSAGGGGGGSAPGVQPEALGVPSEPFSAELRSAPDLERTALRRGAQGRFARGLVGALDEKDRRENPDRPRPPLRAPRAPEAGLAPPLVTFRDVHYEYMGAGQAVLQIQVKNDAERPVASLGFRIVYYGGNDTLVEGTCRGSADLPPGRTGWLVCDRQFTPGATEYEIQISDVQLR